MPAPVAKITLQNNRTYRGVFATADALRNAGTPVNGDLAQVYGNRRYYVYNDSSTEPDNDGVGIPGVNPGSIQPTGVTTGRWLCNVVGISGFDYIEIPLGASQSDPGDGSSITNYEWVIVDEPSGGTPPAAILEAVGSNATLKIPIINSWRPGGVLLFLRVTNNLGESSVSNPFSPLTPRTALFQLISATVNSGFLVPAAGSRNWHVQYRNTFLSLDTTLAGLGGGGGSGGGTLTRFNKRIEVGGTTLGPQSVVPGVEMAYTPAYDSYVRVSVNGLSVELGDGDNTAPCYFAEPGIPGVARAVKDIEQFDQLIWNGPTVGYELDDEDIVELEYLVAFPEPS